MASVYYLFKKSNQFSLDIAKENSLLEAPGRVRHYAALVIQRVYRGYRVRQMVKHWNDAATIIQKTVRGWLVRWHLPEHCAEHLKNMYDIWYNKMATIIQAAWRGYRVRKNMVSTMADIVQNKRLMAEANEGMVSYMREQFKKMGEQGGVGVLSEEDKKRVGEECRQWVLFILFKTHHLLRTKCQEGIYSNHGDTKLSQIEEWMASLPMKKYMKDLKKIYYERYANKKPKIDFIFQKSRYRRCEYFYRTRDRSHELKDVPFKLEIDLHDKPFNLNKTPKCRVDYEPTLIRSEKYRPKCEQGLRALSQCSTGFDLSVHHTKNSFPPVPPPYYIDTWLKKCSLHYLDQ